MRSFDEHFAKPADARDVLDCLARLPREAVIPCEPAPARDQAELKPLASSQRSPSAVPGHVLRRPLDHRRGKKLEATALR